MNSSLVSVILTTYNRCELLSKSISSVLKQDYPQLELVVVDDYSSDDTYDIVREYNDKRINYIRHQKNLGLASARNTGLSASKGKYIAFLDDDDEWLSKKISLQVALISQSKSSKIVVYCGRCDVDENGEVTKEFIPSNKGIFSRHIFSGGGMPSSSMLLLKNELVNIGGHSEDIISCVDHDLWLKMSMVDFSFDYVPRGLIIRNRTVESHIKGQLEARICGIKQFYEKWIPIVKSKYNSGAWGNIEILYENQTYETILSELRKRNISSIKASEFLRQIYALRTRSVSKCKQIRDLLRINALKNYKLLGFLLS